MKKYAVILAFSCLLVGCGGQNNAAQSTEAETTAAEETTVEPSLSAAEEKILATYFGAYGEIFTLFNDHTAEYYSPCVPDPTFDSTWKLSDDGTLTFQSPTWNEIFVGKPPMPNITETFTEKNSEPTNENFRLLSCESRKFSVEEYKQMRRNCFDTGKAEMEGYDENTNQIITFDDISYQLPSYFAVIDDHTSSYSEGENVTLGLKVTVATNCTRENDWDNFRFTNGAIIGMLGDSPTDFWVIDADENDEGEYPIQKIMVKYTSNPDSGSDFDGILRIGSVFNENSGKVYSFVLFESKDAANTHENDFNKIVKSVTVNAAQTANTTAPTETAAAAQPDDNSSGISPGFKATMDSYKAFFDSYVAFMKNYQTSNNQVGMLNDYLDMMKQYNDTMSKLNSLDTSNLSQAEMNYYLDTMNAINKELLDVAQ